MKVAIMQPYLFPYIGYWQLINAADVFIILDDVNYKCRGWINRNRFSYYGSSRYFTLPISHASQNRRIQDTKIHFDINQRKKLIRTISTAYAHAPYSKQICDMVELKFLSDQSDLTTFLKETIIETCEILKINTPVILASSIRSHEHKAGEAGILEICHLMNADTYINPIGGITLYSRENFADEGISLKFLKTNFTEIAQIAGCEGNDFSILDMMMRYSTDNIQKMLTCYDLN